MNSTNGTPSLASLLIEMQSLQENQEGEIARLRQRLGGLEARRREFFSIVAVDSGDLDSLRKLDETDQQIERMQDSVNRAEAEMRQALIDIRQRIYDLVNQEMADLERQLKELRQRRGHIHQDLLPEATARVNALREEEEQLDRQTEEIMRRLGQLTRLDLQAPVIAKPS